MLWRKTRRVLAIIVLGGCLLWIASLTASMYQTKPTASTLRSDNHLPVARQGYGEVVRAEHITDAVQQEKFLRNLSGEAESTSNAHVDVNIENPRRPTVITSVNLAGHPRSTNPDITTRSTVNESDVQYVFPASPAQLFRTHDVRDESPALMDDFYRRWQKVDRACRKKHAPGQVSGVFTDSASRMAYCFVPKAGCTSWIRVFSYLHNYTGENVDSPWAISRLKVHNNKHSHGQPWKAVRQKIEDNYLRFMFVRHPFSRLWSAYLDKLFLPDFWFKIGTRIVRHMRGKNATEHALRCGNDVTFPEFVNYSLWEREPHWDPIYLRCDPCQFRPAVIGNMKTFSKDSLFLLRRMGLQWIMGSLDPQSQMEQELGTLIDYNFNRFSNNRRFKTVCANDTTVSLLLWRTFQINGYISANVSYAVPSSGNISSAEFKSRVLETFRASLPFKQLLKKQKRQFLNQALQSLPPPLMTRVKKKYEQDMIYFDFNDTNY